MTPEIAREFTSTGVLRAALNLGNAVLAHSKTTNDWPAGVTIDLSREFARLVNAPVKFFEYDAPAGAAAALAAGEVDIGFLAVDPKRAESIHFTQPYVEIEGAYLVREDSPVTAQEQVDAEGMRVVVGVGSAYELFLARHLKHAQLVHVRKSEEVVQGLLDDPSAHVAAGVKQQLEADAARVGGVRLLPGAFMTIRQAMAMPRGRSPEAAAALEAFIAQQRRNGFVADALARHGIEGATALR